MYGDESSEAQALQALNLSAATSTATLPLMVRPTHESYMTEADVFVDLVRMQAALPLIDADMAVAECGKCNKAVLIDWATILLSVQVPARISMML